MHDARAARGFPVGELVKDRPHAYRESLPDDRAGEPDPSEPEPPDKPGEDREVGDDKIKPDPLADPPGAANTEAAEAREQMQECRGEEHRACSGADGPEKESEHGGEG